jgi:uncharacterized membrane protein YeaQ/YmgE (transglycosylase-associated protein family)
MLILVGVLVAIIALLVIGALVIGLVFKLVWWVIVGLVIGALARLILPGEQHIGLLATAGSGIAGALLGGVIAHVVGVGNILQFVFALVAAAIIVSVLSASERVRA